MRKKVLRRQPAIRPRPLLPHRRNHLRRQQNQERAERRPQRHRLRMLLRNPEPVQHRQRHPRPRPQRPILPQPRIQMEFLPRILRPGIIVIFIRRKR